jgi:glycine hydroxymethyltransferase
MLGPHGGIILCKKELAEVIDKAVHPGVQSSVPLRRIYEMGSCMIRSAEPWFKNFGKRIIENTKEFENVLNQYPGLMVTGGSDSHLMALNTLKVFGVTGKDAETALEEAGILTNRQVVPGETLKPYIASGLRLGTTWITARGYSKEEAHRVAEIMLEIIKDTNNKILIKNSKKELDVMLSQDRPLDIWRGEYEKI